MEYPYFPLYVQDFLLGTMDMTSEELGGYVRLLLHQWDKGSVPTEEKEIARISKVKPKTIAIIKKKFIQDGDHTMKNVRLEKVRSDVKGLYDKNRNNGRNGGRPKTPKMEPKPNQTDNPKETHGLTEGITQTEPNNNPTGGETKNQSQNQNQTTPRVLTHTPELSPNRPDHAPTWEAVYEVFYRMGNPDEAITFFAHYEAIGWILSGSRITHLSSAVNKWLANPISQAKQAKISAGRKVIMEHNGGEVEWTEEKYEQYRNNPNASGYTFLRYEL